MAEKEKGLQSLSFMAFFFFGLFEGREIGELLRVVKSMINFFFIYFGIGLDCTFGRTRC